jgi:hypothetical protein
MNLAHYLSLLHRSQLNVAAAFREVASAHRDETDVYHVCQRLAGQCDEHVRQLRPFVDRYAADAPDEPERLHSELFRGARTGGLGLIRDLQDLYLMATECDICWTVIGQAAQGARDRKLLDVVSRCEGETATQRDWIRTRMKQAAPQALVVT